MLQRSEERTEEQQVYLARLRQSDKPTATAADLADRFLSLLRPRRGDHADVGLDSEAVLEFSLAADQSYLPAWIIALTHALDVFPPEVPSADTTA